VVVAGSDFVAKSNFNGDLNCKGFYHLFYLKIYLVGVDGKVILAYSTPTWRQNDDIELIDASGLLSAGELFKYIQI
jgi:hypothetical protein